jgi:hypothetical protein
VKANSTQSLFFLGAVSLLLVAITLIASYRGLPFLTEGPSRRIAEAARALWNTGSLQAPEFKKIDREAKQYSKKTASKVWQDAFALGKSGELYPKHSIISVVLTAPFYALFGDWGFLLFNNLTILLLLCFSYRINSYICKRDPAILTLIVVFIFTQLLFYIYSFSYDVLGAAFIVIGIYYIRCHPFLGALIAGFSIFVRPSHLITYPFLLFVWSSKTTWQKRGAFTLFGFSLALALYGLSNYLLWGDFFSTAYHRLPEYNNGNMILNQHPVGFGVSELLQNWDDKLFSLKNGLLTYNSIFFFFPLVFASSLQHKHRHFLLLMLCLSSVYTLYIFSYEHWSCTAFGNRFLYPAIFAYLFTFIAFIDRLRTSFRRSEYVHN